MVGDNDRVDISSVAPHINKVLAVTRHRIGKTIKSGMERPKDINPIYWESIAAKLETREWQKKSEQMRSIVRIKATTAVEMKSIEREVIGRLVSTILTVFYTSI